MIRTNPCKVIDRPRQNGTHKEMLFLTAEQVAQLAQEVPSQYRTLILFAAYSGMRADEIDALRVKNVNPMQREVRVTRVGRRRQRHDPHRCSKDRTVILPSSLRELLMEQVAGKDPDAFVFSATDKPMRHGNFYRRHYRPAVKRLTGDESIPKEARGGQFGAWPEDLRGLRFHDLRHTCASLLIHEGSANLKAISEYMGHSSINITLDLYGHLYPEAREAVGKAWDKIYREAPKPVVAEVMALQSASGRAD